jgi:ELWxxDGT repeat protein
LLPNDMKHTIRRTALQLEILEDRRVLATGPQMLADVHPQIPVPGFSEESDFVQVGNAVYFTGFDSVHGSELWRTDGTSTGTVLVKDTWPGTHDGLHGGNTGSFTNVNGTLFFLAFNGTNGFELWKSNGTSAGTVLVRDVSPVAYYHFKYLTNINGTLFFSADDGTHGYELWKSDGTSAGTVMVRDLNAGSAGSYPTNIANVNGTLFLSADDGLNGWELWKSNGTSAGTVLVRDINPGGHVDLNTSKYVPNSSNPQNLTNVGGRLFFSADDGTHGLELWKSDGTSTGTTLVRDVNGWSTDSSFRFSHPASFTNVNGTLFFTQEAPALGEELWKSDGTSAGTVLVRDINPGGYFAYDPNGNSEYIFASSRPADLVNVNGTLYFFADGGLKGDQLWKSNGTSSGTTLVWNINPGGGRSGGFITNVSGTLFFDAHDDAHGQEVWRSNGTSAGTVLLRDLRPGNGGTLPHYFTNINGTLYFSAASGVGALWEFWKSNGTSAGTTMVVPVYADANPDDFVQVGGFTYFTADDGVHGRELWKTNGTSAGTSLVRDIRTGAGSSFPLNLINVNGTLFFTAFDGTTGRELWKSNGTSAGTVLVRDIRVDSSGSFPKNLTDMGGILFFSADDGTTGRELWKSNGTSAGTVLVRDIRPGLAASFVSPGPVDGYTFLNVQGMLFFNVDDGGHGEELWKSNGSSAGTMLVRDINPGTHYDPTLKKNVPNLANPVQLTNVNGTLFFTAYDVTHGRELWKSNGTSAGTILIRDVRPSIETSTPLNLVNVNGTLFFTAFDGTTGRELWKTNGTSAGTVLVRDIRPGGNNAFPGSLTNVNGTLYFTAFDDAHGVELWKSNGTSSGTILVRDILPGIKNSNPTYGGSLTNVNGLLFFRAADGTHGTELWQSNGTSIGTVLVRDIRVGSAGSSPVNLANAGGRLFFAADDGTRGIEPWFATPPNTAPQLNAAKSPVFNPIVQNAGLPIGAVGTLVSKLVNMTGALANVTDPDYGARTGLAITAADTTHGTWFFSLNGGATWTALGVVGNTGARLLAADGLTRLYFKPTAGFKGSIAQAITFRAWDQSSGANGGFVTTQVNGGTAAFSTAIDTASINVF